VRLHRSTAPPATVNLGSSSTCSSSSGGGGGGGGGGGSQVVGTAKPREAETAKRLGQSYWPCERRLSEPGSARRPAGASGSNNTAATVEFFMDRPVQPTFAQERNNLHAVEVSSLDGGRGGDLEKLDRLDVAFCNFSQCMKLYPLMLENDQV